MPPETATAAEEAPQPTVVELKLVEGLEIKDEEKGEIEAVIATLEVVDRDRDIIRKGAIPDGAKVKLSDYAHSAVFGTAPVGKGKLSVKGDKVLFRGNYFMSTSRGVEAFRTMKEIGTDDQEWSFGFHVVGVEMPDDEGRKKGAWRILTKLDSFEVSPVLRGAGIGTRTLAVKSAALGAQEVKEEAELKQAEQAEAQRLAEAQESERKTAEEVETKRLTDEAETKRKAEEAESKLKVAEAEVLRLTGELELAKKTAADEADAERKAEAAEAKRILDEAEAKRLAEVEAQGKKDAAIRLASTLEFERFQRTLQRPFVNG